MSKLVCVFSLFLGTSLFVDGCSDSRGNQSPADWMADNGPVGEVHDVAQNEESTTDTSQPEVSNDDAAPEGELDIDAKLVEVSSDARCFPDCEGKNCGSDGCVGTCGTCNDANPCTEDTCTDEGVCEYSPQSVCTGAPKCPTGPCEELHFDAETGAYEVVDTCTANGLCTLPVCNADGSCSYVEKCPDNSSQGLVSACSPQSGECNWKSDCSSDDPCLSGDLVDGECVFESKCAPPNACQVVNCSQQTGECLYGPIDCDDEDPCTEDWCHPALGCVSSPACCKSDEDCLDENPCTTDLCVADLCLHDDSDLEFCCLGDGDCSPGGKWDDGNIFTDGKCNTVLNLCEYLWSDVPCISPQDCDDGEPCSKDICLGSQGCAHVELFGCCETDNDCDIVAADMSAVCVSNVCKSTCLKCLGDEDDCTREFCDPSQLPTDPMPEDCLCKPLCDGKECGPDSCGGLCGWCSGDFDSCISGECVCQPRCKHIQCGDDSCGGSCGMCVGGLVCAGGMCVMQ